MLFDVVLLQESQGLEQAVLAYNDDIVFSDDLTAAVWVLAPWAKRIRAFASSRSIAAVVLSD